MCKDVGVSDSETPKITKNEAVLYRKYILMLQLLNINLNHFPKHEKYGLSLSIRQAAYRVYELIIETQKRYYKKTTMTEMDIEHEKLRMLLHLAFELGYFNYKNAKIDEERDDQRRYLAVSHLVDEIGRILGGWIKKTREEGNLR